MAALVRNGVSASEEGMMISERASSSLTVRNREYVNEMKSIKEDESMMKRTILI